MIKVYPAESRYSSNLGWLKCNFSFSFGEYYESDNINFGPLRVFNDDFIQPQKGFGTHPHRDMEIVTIVLEGHLKHEDNTGGKGILGPGEVQRMTAGTGILHSEFNASSEETANTLQLWFLPEEKGLTPSYEQKSYDREAAVNHLLPVVSGRLENKDITFIHQDLTIYMSELLSGQSIAFSQEESRKIYLFVIEGELVLNKDSKLKKRDAARITDVTKLDIDSAKGASFMLIDLP